jgi:hypothetical protein
MALQDWLLPNEEIKYTASGNVRFAASAYRFNITNERIILYQQIGTFFKKENVIAERLEDIISMAYSEGYELFAKFGYLKVQTTSKTVKYAGRPENMKALWQELQQYIRN